MQTPLIFATNNQHKILEVQSIVGSTYQLITLQQAGINIDIPEPHDTIIANAIEKANVIYKLTNKNCFAEDTGLEVEALSGEPGVHSARYAGEERSHEKNIEKLLNKLADSENRTAQFRTVVALMLNGKQYVFEGICKGTITQQPMGGDGFGYDPIFMPLGSLKTFAQMNLDEKNLFSHRQKAIVKLIDFLKDNAHFNG